MKTKFLILFALMLLCTYNKAQWYGQLNYSYGGSTPYKLSSALITTINVGYLMAGPAPIVTSAGNNFVITKVSPDGAFSSATDFANEYQIIDNCNAAVNGGSVYSCKDIEVTECSDFGNGETYAFGGITDSAVFFSTADALGVPISYNLWAFPTGSNTPHNVSIAKSSDPRNYYIAGDVAGQTYVLKVDATANPVSIIWAHWYDFNYIIAKDIIESPYDPSEVIVVGRIDSMGVLGSGADGFFMNLKSSNGNINYIKNYSFYKVVHCDNWFKCIAPASAVNGGAVGYILGGRSQHPIPAGMGGGSNDDYTQWMCKLDLDGNIIWSSLIQPRTSISSFTSIPISGGEISGVYERFNSNNSTYEYYGVANSFVYTDPISGPTIQDNIVTYKLDENGNLFNGTVTPTEFHYMGGSAIVEPGNLVNSTAEITGIETGGGSDDGVQVYGNANDHYMVKAYFNGASDCQEYFEDIRTIHQGPDSVWHTNGNMSNFSGCNNIPIVNSTLNVAPLSISPSTTCVNSSLSSGSNARMALSLTSTHYHDAFYSVYPNPNNGLVFVSINHNSVEQKAIEISLYNSLGQLIDEKRFDNLSVVKNNSVFDLHQYNLGSGIYYMSIISNTTNQQFKLVYNSN